MMFLSCTDHSSILRSDNGLTTCFRQIQTTPRRIAILLSGFLIVDISSIYELGIFLLTAYKIDFAYETTEKQKKIFNSDIRSGIACEGLGRWL